jgi:hypothetical protein
MPLVVTLPYLLACGSTIITSSTSWRSPPCGAHLWASAPPCGAHLCVSAPPCGAHLWAGLSAVCGLTASAWSRRRRFCSRKEAEREGFCGVTGFRRSSPLLPLPSRESTSSSGSPSLQNNGCEFMKFWCGSGSADPYPWLIDPDPECYFPVTFFFLIFLLITVLFEGTFTSFFKDKKSYRSRKTVGINVFITVFCLMTEQSGSVSLINWSGSGGPKTYGSYSKIKKFQRTVGDQRQTRQMKALHGEFYFVWIKSKSFYYYYLCRY